MRIGDHLIGESNPVYIIAEAGVNHFGSLERALRLVDMAKGTGANAFKLQVYRTEKMISSSAGEWFDRMKCKELAEQTLFEVRDHAIKSDLDFIASAHDEESLDFLSELGVEAIKIGSGEMLNTPFLEKASSKGLPVIYSTGMQTLDDVALACEVFERQEAEFALLHCVTLYPTLPDETNLRAIETLKKKFCVPIGYSDHTEDSLAVFAAVAMGAAIIEKHIALERNVPNTQDPAVSCVGTDELSAMVEGIRRVEAMMGNGTKEPVPRENQSIAWARKSLVATRRIKEGTILTRDMICCKRPGTGIPASQLPAVIGRKLKISLEADDLLQWHMLDV